MKTSETIGKFAEALAKAQGLMKAAVFDATNPFFKSKYATLASVMDACREPLSVNGIAVIQGGSVENKRLTVTTMLVHSSGEFISDDLTMTITKDSPQDIGSALTYARRYSISSMVGIVSDNDDDAEGDKGNKPTAKKTNPKPEASSKSPAAEKAEKKKQESIKHIFALAKKTGLKTDQDVKTSIENIIDKKIKSSSELNLKQIETIIDSYNKCIENSKKANVIPPKEKTSNVDDKPNTLTSLDKLKNILANKSLKAASLEVCKSMSISLSELMTAPDAIVTAFVNKILNNEQGPNPITQGEKIAANIKLARGMLVKLGCKTIEDCQTLAGSLIDRELKIDGDLHELSAAEMDTLIDKLDIQLSGL